MISYALAFLAAIVNATGDVLNRKASREAPAHLAFRFRLFAHLLRRRTWLAAAALMVTSFVLAAAALGTGQLASVQLIVILELPLTLVGSAWFLGGQLPARDWAAIVAMTAGVIGLLVLLDPATWAWRAGLCRGLAGRVCGQRQRDHRPVPGG